MRGINHPQLTRHSNTDYILTNPTSPYKRILHAGQIAKFLAYDKSLRDGRTPDRMLGIPMGYDEFAEVFNQYRQPKDRREFSIVTVEQSEERVLKSRHPVTLKDFFITAEQCGLGTSSQENTDKAGALVFERFAKDKAKADQRRDEAIQQRKDRKRKGYSAPDKQRPKRRRYYDDEDEQDGYYDEEDETTLEIFEDLPDSAVNPPLPTSTASTSALTPVPVASSNLPTIIDLRNQNITVPEAVTTVVPITADELQPEQEYEEQPMQE
jgi:hypothetical protein